VYYSINQLNCRTYPKAVECPMSDHLLACEWLLRLGVFGAVFALMALAEWAAPARALTLSKRRRWATNLSLLALNTIAVRLLFPAAAVGIAISAQQSGSGLLNMLRVPDALAFIVSFLLLDLGIYLQHVLFHRVPALWRLHRVHHLDADLDVTTGNRFHPIEMLLSMAIKSLMILALGAPWLAVLAFEIVLNAAALFNHANVRLPARVERSLRWIIVTPDMHRIHHSSLSSEYNRNFGFNLPWWDRLLGTYTPEPRDGHAAMRIGVLQPQAAAAGASLGAMLALPLQR
jgi:sterol desaturase/sphingolipid hydroxylase (fatty acid hydroxylase superfamily)